MLNDFQKKLILNIGIIVSAAVVFITAFYFLSDKIDILVKDISARKTLLASQSAEVDNLAKLKADQAQSINIKKRMDALLPTKNGILNFGKSVDALARVHSVSVGVITRDAAEATISAAGYSSFTINATGGLKDIRDFLSDLEFRAPSYLVSLDGIDISAQGGAYRADVSGRVFFQ